MKVLGFNEEIRKVFFTKSGAAVTMELVQKNPSDAKKILTNLFKVEEKNFVDRESGLQIDEQLPNTQWRLLFCLTRFAGLRVPSELKLLCWNDVDWDKGRMTLRAPKTPHHRGHKTRTVPLFPDVRKYLQKPWDQAEEGGTTDLADASG